MNYLLLLLFLFFFSSTDVKATVGLVVPVAQLFALTPC
jgi:hypothetical protein